MFGLYSAREFLAIAPGCYFLLWVEQAVAFFVFTLLGF